MSDVTLWREAEQGANTQLNADQLAGVFCRRQYVLDIANGTAGTAVTESVIDHLRRPGLVKSITLTAPIAVTADNTNNATITVAKRTGSGAAQTIATIATSTTGTNNLVAFVPFTIPASAFTAANTQLAAGDVLTVAIGKGGTGVALSAATSFFTVSVDIEEN